MNVFVVGTGRCGTSTFYQACRTIQNYTAGHESEAGHMPTFDFAPGHIEISSQLVYAIPLLRERYPDARWVHLVRERTTCVQSLITQLPEALLAFSFHWFQCRPRDRVPPAGAGEWFYDLTVRLCVALLAGAPVMTIPMERMAEHWPTFCDWIGAVCDLPEGRTLLRRRYNAGERRGRDVYVEEEAVEEAS